MSIVIMIFKRYTLIIERLVTYIGCLFIYILGMGLGKMLFYIFSLKHQNLKWQKHDSQFNLEKMY